MRATSSIVVLSSLLNAAVVLAAPDDKKGANPAPKSGRSAKKPKSGTPAKQPAPTTGAPANQPPSSIPAMPGQSPAPAPDSRAAIDPATVKPEDMPTAVRMRRLEQRTQALKERAWQLKARVQLLKEQMLGPGVGAQALITHANEMGSSFRLIKLIYTLNGTQVFVRSDEAAESLYKTKSFDIFAGPISPGNHNLAVVATYRGNGYGVFEYLKKYTFVANGKQAFTVGEGKTAKVACKGFEKGGPTTPMEKRAAVECTVTHIAPEKPPAAPAATTPTAPAATTPTAPAAPAATPPTTPAATTPAPAAKPRK
ncbi:MAG TPA: hypothetical protein VNO30_03545 [Kofleriaceae bacterium]|nr:hypothetical protein [Kofleriaceae bacterium]